MIQVLEHSEGRIIAAKAIKKLTKTDYDKLLPLLISKLKQFPKIRMYFEMDNFEGWELKALWEDVDLDLRHANVFEKVAMVGEKKWEDWMKDFIKPFTSAEIKYFEPIHKEEAIIWIKS